MRPNPRHVRKAGQGRLAQARLPRRVVLWVIGIAAGFLLSVVVLFGASAANMMIQGNRVLDAAQNLANAALGCGSEDSLGDSASELVDSTRQLRNELNKPQWTWVRDHTPYGNDITAARTVLNSVGNLVDGPFTDLADLSKDLSGFSKDGKQVDLSALMKVPDIVSSARSQIAQEVTALKNLDQPRLPQVAQVVSAGITGLQSVDGILDNYSDLLDLIPQLLGADGARTYLVAVENTSELRSDGGMVGNYAPITADNGLVTIGDFNSTIDFKNPGKSFDEEGALEGKTFGMQVYNWPQTTTVNPNYPRVAVTFRNLWQFQPGNEDTDVAGVMMIDPVFMQALVGATGAVTLDDGTVLDGTNTVRFFGRDIYVNYPDFEEQNTYVSAAAKTIMNHVLSNANASTASNMLKAIREMTASSHFKLWMDQQDEFDAMVATGLIDENASGALPDDETQPVSGIYLNQSQASKLDWYLQTQTVVTRNCAGDDCPMRNSWISDKVDAQARSTSLGTVPSTLLGDEYTVEFTMTNTMTREQARSLPDFVTGSSAPGTMKYSMYLMAPQGGMITSVAYESGEKNGNGMIYGRQFLGLRLLIEPGESVTIAYTVRVPKNAAQVLDVVTTPIVNDLGVQTGSLGKATDAATGEELTAEALTPVELTEREQAMLDRILGRDEETGEGEGTEGTGDAGTGTGEGSGDIQQPTTPTPDPSEGLSALDKIKNGLSCPVDLRKLL